MWKDSIVEEIRNNRDNYAKKFNYDIHAICQDIRQNERSVIFLSPKRVDTSKINKLPKS